MKYDGIIVFRKMTNLLPWFEPKAHELLVYIRRDDPTYNLKLSNLRAFYAKPRNVSLYLMVRYDGRRTFCTIKCPINPLPVKDEFIASSLHDVKNFLLQQGWNETEAIATHLMK